MATTLPPTTKSNNDTKLAENVTEWLKKSFAENKNELSTQPALKQYRRNSASIARVIVDEPIVEINLSRHYYLKKQESTNKNLTSETYIHYSKSQTHISTDDSHLYLIEPSDDIKKILLYKDPKEMSIGKEEFNKTNIKNERRPSVSLGLQIVSTQFEHLDDNKSGAFITSIEPDGLIDKFNVSINEGDEIVEVCGVNLRNKSDSQIDEIIDQSCKRNNGELELLIRRSNSIKNKPNIIRINDLESKYSYENSTDNNELFYEKNNKSISNNHHNKVRDSHAFNEISIKKKGTRARNHETLIADPALLFAIKNNKRIDNQSRSFSPNINRPRIKLETEFQDISSNQPVNTMNRNCRQNQKVNNSNSSKTLLNNDIRRKPIRSSNSPVDLDEFRALSNRINKPIKITEPTDFDSNVNNDTENEALARNLSEGSTFSNTGISNSSSRDENVSVFSYNLSQKESPSQLKTTANKVDDKSSGYNSNQSTPTSELNSAKADSKNKLQPDTLIKSKSKNCFFGEIMIQLSHDNEKNELIVKILKAKNLISKDSNGFSDPYCKLYLLPGRESENKRRTKTICKSLNPVWNETFVYSDVYREEVFNKTLEFTLFDWDRFSRDDFLGILKIDLKDPSYLDNTPRWFILGDLPHVNTHSESDNAKSKRDFKSRLSFKRSKSLRRSSYK